MIISSPDTDVAWYYMFSENIMYEIWLKSCIGVNIRYLPIHDITDQLGFSVVELLPTVHSITVCSSVSNLFGTGKKNAFETMKENSENLTDMSLFGGFLSL